MKNTNEELGKRIEQFVVEHRAATRTVAREAVERALAASAMARPVSIRPERARRAGGGKRRGAIELAALGERFYRALCSKPRRRWRYLRRRWAGRRENCIERWRG